MPSCWEWVLPEPAPGSGRQLRRALSQSKRRSVVAVQAQSSSARSSYRKGTFEKSWKAVFPSRSGRL